ncbi:MAG: sigma-70 family RNA polymerase sigma factor [bacterium]|nr:MAG: sigma-70 family RNA polymerase sigma factor [bacterium]
MNFLRKKYKLTSDEQLMMFVQQGNEDAFLELYERYSKKLLYYFYRMLFGDHEKAQDFLQDLFLKIVEKPELFDHQKKFSTWLYTIAHNQCKNEYRRLEIRRRFNQKEKDSGKFSESGNGMEKYLDTKLFQSALEKKLYKLGPEQRLIFILRFQEDLSIKEISEITGMKEGTLKSRLFYLTRKLGQDLKDLNPVYSEV